MQHLPPELCEPPTAAPPKPEDAARSVYHAEYGCIECGGRTLGCTSTHCAVDHALREMDAVEFHRFAERTRYLNRAVTFEAIRRVFGAEIR